MFGASKTPSLLSSIGGTAPSASESAGEVVLGFATAGSAVAKNPCPCCELTLRQRLIGFVSCFGIGMHRPEFDHAKGLPVAADPGLHEKHRPRP
jgi:hypothetical protein